MVGVKKRKAAHKLWIVVAIAGFIVFVLLLLSVPFELVMQLEVYGKPDLRLKWTWLFGLVSKGIEGKKRRLSPKRRRKKRKFELIRILNGIRIAADYVGIEGLIKQLALFIKDVIRRIQVRKLEGEFYTGFEDPIDTSYLFFTFIQPVNLLLSRSQPYAIAIMPSWVGPTFEGRMRAEFRIYPVRLAQPLLRFMLSRTALRGIKAAVLFKWKSKR